MAKILNLAFFGGLKIGNLWGFLGVVGRVFGWFWEVWDGLGRFLSGFEGF